MFAWWTKLAVWQKTLLTIALSVGPASACGWAFPHVIGEGIVWLFQLDTEQRLFKQPLPRSPKHSPPDAGQPLP